VNSIAFSPDGTRAVTASFDKTARVWDIATGKPLTGQLVHQGWVLHAAFSPEGMRVVTASWDGATRVWDAATGRPLTGRLVHHWGPVRTAAFSPDGTRLITAGEDKTAWVWDVRPDTGTLGQWSAVAERSPFVLDERGVLVRRIDPRSSALPGH
jgi:WD40 repeat protein